MNDSENLSKLLGHLPPGVFREFMASELDVAIPALDATQGKREQRAAMEAVLSALPVGVRQKAEEVAERIVLLSDGAGQDVIEGFRDDIFEDAAKAAFNAINNQYERALWLYTNEPKLFKEAVDARQADVFRQSASCYSGFVAPTKLIVKSDPATRAVFHHQYLFPTLHPVGVFLPVPACLRGFVRVDVVCAPEKVSRFRPLFALSRPFVSPTARVGGNPRTNDCASDPYTNQEVTRGPSEQFICSIGRHSIRVGRTSVDGPMAGRRSSHRRADHRCGTGNSGCGCDQVPSQAVARQGAASCGVS
jgi:hypothetical protein